MAGYPKEEYVLLYPGWVTKVLGRRHLVTRGIQALFYACDMSGMSKGILAELTYGNMGSEIPTYVRNDNPDASYRVDPESTVDKEDDLMCF